MFWARFKRHWHCYFGVWRYIFGRSQDAHQAVTLYEGFKTTWVGCTCGKEWT